MLSICQLAYCKLVYYKSKTANLRLANIISQCFSFGDVLFARYVVESPMRFEYRARANILSFAKFAVQCLIGDFLRADVLSISPLR